LISISRNLAPFGKLSWKVILRSTFWRVPSQYICDYPLGRGLSTHQVKIFKGARVNGIRATWPVHRRSRRWK
jgi:hypothetical protein